MRGFLATLALALLLALPALAVTAAPRLTVLDRTPLVLRGSGFRPAERVVLRALTPEGGLRKVVSSRATGTFVVRFAQPAGPCAISRVTARGSLGSFAILRVASVPGACQPAGVSP